MPEISDVFFRRKHPRLKYEGIVIVHDNQSVWKGLGVEVSLDGAGVVMEDSSIHPGEILYLHFKTWQKIPAFNVTCEVMSKRFVEAVTDKNKPIRYGLSFKEIKEEAKSILQQFKEYGEPAA
jgi:hypothetical protein